MQQALLDRGYVVRILSPKYSVFAVEYRGGGQTMAEQEEEHMRRRLRAGGAAPQALATAQAISTLSTLPGILLVEEDAQLFLAGRRELLAAAPPPQQLLLQQALVQEGDSSLQPDAMCSYNGLDVPAVSGAGSVEFTPYGLKALQALDPLMLQTSKSLSSKVGGQGRMHTPGVGCAWQGGSRFTGGGDCQCAWCQAGARCPSSSWPLAADRRPAGWPGQRWTCWLGPQAARLAPPFARLRHGQQAIERDG